MDFKFYENFFDAINLLPEGEREKACYEFCKYGITGELPKDKNLAMFCLGVSVSVQKYQGRGGYRENSGRKKSNEIENQKNQKNQKNQNEQTETKTETKTLTEAEAENTPAPSQNFSDLSEWLGEYSNVHLTSSQYSEFTQYVGKKAVADSLIDELSANIAQKKENAPPYDDNFPDMHLVKLKAYWKYRKLGGGKVPKEDKAAKFKNELDELTKQYRLKECGSG